MEEAIDSFLGAAASWLCDSYSVDIRYFAQQIDGEWAIWAASVGLFPIPTERDHELNLISTSFVLGQHESIVKRASAMRLLHDVVKGKLLVHGRRLSLLPTAQLSYYSEMQQRNRWFCDLHLQVQGTRRPAPTAVEALRWDNTLRSSEIPFDGIEDSLGWLGLPTPWSASQAPAITVRIGPPVDLVFEECALRENELSLVLRAHRKFDVSTVGLAIRAVPGDGLRTRRQIGKDLAWRSASNFRLAHLSVPIDRADNALTILMIGDTVVRRQWFIDPARARNNRYFAMQHFDSGLRMARKAVLESAGRDFETGVAALLFMLGFGPCAPIETDAPDLIVTTPQGRLVLVECTTRLADVAAKLGKLVQRRGSLSINLESAGHVGDVVAVLVCQAPRAQIAAQMEDFRLANVLLVTGDALGQAFDTARFPQDPDTLLDEAMEALQRNGT